MNRPDPSISLNISGRPYAVRAEPGRRLSEILREELGLKSVKVGCDAGDCGACTVLIDGAQHCACLTPLAQAAGRTIETLETAEPDLSSRLQQAFLQHGAAQCGICTPGIMMAAVELLRANPTPKAADVEDALGGVLCRCTGYRKIISAVMAASGTATAIPTPDPGNAVGQPVQRLDGPAKVDGSEIFGADFYPKGAYLVRAVRSPYHHASFILGDIAAWQANHPAVRSIVTAVDIEGENRFGVIPPFADQPALAEDIIRYRGEPIALVVGDEDGIETLDLESFPVTWTLLEHRLTPAEGDMADAPLLHQDRERNTLVRGRVASGSPDQALAHAAHLVTGTVETSYVEHAYIEPEAGAAWLEGETLVIQACTQAPIMDRDDTAKVLDLPREKVRIIPAAAGGGFGGKLDLSVQPLLGLAVLKTGHPCRMVYTRSESMRSSPKRHPGKDGGDHWRR